MVYMPEGGSMPVKTLYDLLVRSSLIEDSGVAGFGEDIQKIIGKRIFEVPCDGVTTRTVPSVSSSDARAIWDYYKAVRAKNSGLERA